MNKSKEMTETSSYYQQCEDHAKSQTSSIAETTKETVSMSSKKDWQSLIPKEYVILTNEAKTRLVKEGRAWETLSEDEQVAVLEDAPVWDKMILLNGFKEVADIRGFISRRDGIIESGPERVVASCEIEWIPENGRPLTVRSISAATTQNVDKGRNPKVNFHHFLERIALNRAFICCVKDSLGIKIFGKDELKDVDGKYEDNESQPPSLKDMPRIKMKQLMKEKKVSFGSVKAGMERRGIKWESEWVDEDSLPPNICSQIISALKEVSKEKS